MVTPELYDRLLRRCTTPNELRAVQILLDQRMTAAEAFAIAERARGSRSGAVQIDEVSREWAEASLANLSQGPRPGRFERIWIRGGAALYRPAGVRPGHIAVCFSGDFLRLMMPTPVILQAFDGHEVAVLKLDAPRRTFNTAGIPGFSTSFRQTVAWLARFVAEGGYHRVSTFGSSAGCLPALLAGRALGATAALAAGPAMSSIGDLAPPAQSLAALIEAFASSTPMRTTIAFSDSVAADVTAAQRLAELLPVDELLAIPRAPHGCLFPLARAGELPPAPGAHPDTRPPCSRPPCRRPPCSRRPWSRRPRLSR